MEFGFIPVVNYSSSPIIEQSRTEKELCIHTKLKNSEVKKISIITIKNYIN